MATSLGASAAAKDALKVEQALAVELLGAKPLLLLHRGLQLGLLDGNPRKRVRERPLFLVALVAREGGSWTRAGITLLIMDRLLALLVKALWV